MRGNLEVDFAVGTALFIFAFVAAFSYINYEYNSRLSHESDEASRLKIAHLMESLPKQSVEKRIIVAEGYSENEFVNLSEYRIDLVLDEKGGSICFDKGLGGFIADVSGTRTFSLYSVDFAGMEIERNLCRINLSAANNNIHEKVSSPVYLELFAQAPSINSSGSHCDKIPVSYFSGKGIEEKLIDVCG
jgi:hypothetical protein